MNAQSQIQEAVRLYFQGERGEMYLILAGSAAVLGLAFWLYSAYRGSFTRVFGLSAVFVALLVSATAVSLLFRDKPHEAALLTALNGEAAPTAAQVELQRVQVIISKYPIYRYSCAGLALLGLIAAVIWRTGASGGLAAGLLLMLAAQVLIDHYSEKRANIYAAQLTAFLSGQSTQVSGN